MKNIILPLLLILTTGLSAQENRLLELLEKNKSKFAVWLDAPEKHQVQIIYTQIDRDEKNQPHFTSHSYGLDTNRYYYPASTVKMPVAFVALEKLNELNIIGLDKYSQMEVEAGRLPQTSARSDYSAEDSLATIAHYIKKIFLVSDNDAYNRLYEFVGQEYLNRKLREKNFKQSRIIHRLSLSGYDAIGNQYTNPVRFLSKDGTLLYYQGEVYSKCEHQLFLTEELRGKAYMKNSGEIIKEAFDFREKNFISLPDLNEMLKAVMFPEAVASRKRFNLTKEDYAFLYEHMSMLPRESDFPKYTQQDNYVKFWIYGDQDSTATIPPYIRIFNKVGWAYGFLTDVSYVVDLKNNVEFMLAAVIQTNANETYNDGVYEYEEIALPFFGELGREVYDMELKRKRAYLPDFNWLGALRF